MGYSLTRETFASLESIWKDPAVPLDWGSIFVLPAWLKTWWEVFSPGGEPYIAVAREDNTIIGIAPLQVKEGTASFIGSADVCDYIDFIVAPGREREFVQVLLTDLPHQGIRRLDPGLSRPESAIVMHLVDMLGRRGNKVSCVKEAVSLELDLPPAWEKYLDLLGRKQKHELKRKMRRLGEAGDFEYRIVGGVDANGLVDAFFKLFKESREDKDAFLTETMESFFRGIVRAMGDIDLLRFGVLELDKKPVAMVLFFDYHGIIYLYNSGYDREYAPLSVGLLSKALLINDSIKKGKKHFDFLKGGEPYKYLLGGKEVPLYRCEAELGHASPGGRS